MNEIIADLNAVYYALEALDTENEIRAAQAKIGEAIKVLGGEIADPPEEE
jgi:hypothetical protein